MLDLTAAYLGGAFHVASRGLLLFRLVKNMPIYGLSLITQELFLITYLMRYLELLAIFVSITDFALKVAKISVALGIVLLIRYSPAVNKTYEAELDTVPRILLLTPPFLLAIIYNRVAMVVEIFHQFSWYLEPLVLVPQFALMYKRQKYDTWVAAFTALAAAESVSQNLGLLTQSKESLVDNPYGFWAAVAQVCVLAVGVMLLIFQKVAAAQQAGLNESVNKPNFGEVWEANKFQFNDDIGGNAAKPAAAGTSTASAV
uniref:Uncharacterized protein n=1 Tax=Chlamydomonas leiostraca TaxID=1034604 RepID=A0A7S0WPI8_9CHLO|mmetsp:Transcript_22266/g.56651  ORF Transcript_22266/g.56651 Transcript_22266/m.56651 type:complete len:258 (+) Transcript_22266:86-859(+)|eukprot:CAMPEP_0202867520 /NCGR_PEP_ID=MMETSP1391-20130828/9481_1 /ASSEMBLY_ACC=CAM_ASM_000867 /TAXON_ID=1034604 /ORGANISM="Chlamydomonas leiostraca, Strain SAG 11-49" /LENGTH=257 /DNA_ID=CAMNT_0049547571 /DNA_START=79 /DNA_END=852 /DNA_ORIENTATION=-